MHNIVDYFLMMQIICMCIKQMIAIYGIYSHIYAYIMYARMLKQLTKQATVINKYVCK